MSSCLLPAILYSRRPEGRLLFNQEKMGIIDQKILSCSPTVKEKFAAWILLDNSANDEYSEVSKEFWGHPGCCPPTFLEGENGPDSFAL